MKSFLKVHELPPEKLKNREVVYIDIANDSIPSSDYKPDLDPTTFKSVKTGRGPFTGNKWWVNQKPVMTCYKLVTVEFKWFGLQVILHFFLFVEYKPLLPNDSISLFVAQPKTAERIVDDVTYMNF